MVKQLSSETLARMDPVNKEKYESLPQEVEEEIEEEPAHQSGNNVCGSLEEALRTPAASGVRFHTERIVGTDKAFRFRSLNTEEWLNVRDTEKNILELSLCDCNGHKYLDADGVKELQLKYDARSYAHLIEVANEHCFAGLTLEGMREAAAKNLLAPSTTSTS